MERIGNSIDTIRQYRTSKILPQNGPLKQKIETKEIKTAKNGIDGIAKMKDGKIEKNRINPKTRKN